MSNECIEYTACAGCISHGGQFLGQGGDFNHHEQAGNQLYRDHRYLRALIPCQHGHNKKSNFSVNHTIDILLKHLDTGDNSGQEEVFK
jgi:hypothetical protein